ncbi:MAG: hypothetical protein QOK21_2485 [Solirubrobacteraceae bacterium]|nr:hypothetical protein [Solirubrobacteraceae bacterium]
MSRRVTLATVAEALGVSPMTVSNAYNRPEKLSAELRRHILATAAELGYPGPHATARSLRRGRSGALGVVLGEALPYAFEDLGAVEFLRGFARGSAGAGVALELLPVTGDAQDAAHVLAAVVDGFAIFALPEGHSLVAAVEGRGLPVVTHGSPVLAGRPFVGIDDAAAARAVADHLRDLGHRRVAAISFPLGYPRRDGAVALDAPASHRVTRERLRGFAGTATTAFEVSLNERGAGEAAAGALLDGPAPPTALLCMSDELALGALTALRARGLSVPGDVSVTGWDDRPEAARADPPLTTIRQSLREQGAAVAELLVSGADRPERRLEPWQLVVRASTAPPP